jgi:hypothetical protein
MRAEETAMRFMLVLPLMLMGCATTPSPQATAVRDADQKMVEGCEFVGDIMGTSPLGVVFGGMSTANAREMAVGQAADRGATHMVWASITPPSFGSGAIASGKAYRCAA